MTNGAQNASGTPAPAASHSGGHVVSARATTIGLMAILLWSFMAGTVRIVSENFGATLGSALIYTVGGILLLLCSLWILFQPLVFGTTAVIVWVGISLLFAGVAACSLSLQLHRAHRCLGDR